MKKIDIKLMGILSLCFVHRVISQDSKSCEEIQGDISECVNCYPCSDMRSRYLEDVTYLRIRNGSCTSWTELCCQSTAKSIMVRPKPTTSTTRPPAVGVRAQNAICGLRNPDGVGAFRAADKPLSEDTETLFGEFPWVVVVYKIVNKGTPVYSCAGALISAGVVITAGHCVAARAQSNLPVRVSAGDWDIDAEAELQPHQTLDVARIVVHENYYDGGLHNDIAMLILQNEFVLSDNVAPVCLPISDHLPGPEKTCYVTSWGKSHYGPGKKYQKILHKRKVRWVDHKECQTLLRNSSSGPDFTLHRSAVCAQAQGVKELCRGDGGSPLVCKVEDQQERYAIYGLSSWGAACDSTPRIYTRVPKLRLWVDDQLRKYTNVTL